MSVLLDGTTRVLVQGITGQQARRHVGYMRAYGTNVVAGVAPGRGGQAVDGVPVFDTVRSAVRAHPADLAVLFVPARSARDAALEAIEAGIGTVVVLAEGVPHHDGAEVIAAARRKGVRVVGPNSQGMISPGKAKIGGTGGPIPERMFRPGPVGIVSRSGGMGGEIGFALTRAGIGQSTYVAIGGDLMIGTAFADLAPLYEADPETEALVIFGEAGTAHEEDMADLVASGRFTKPVVALIVGEALEAVPRGTSFGHTSALVGRGLGSTSGKKRRLREAGARVAEVFSDVPRLVAEALASRRGPGAKPDSR